MHRIAPALLALVLASCGGSPGTTPRGQRTASDCERLMRHTIETLAAENGAGAPNAEQRREIESLIAERCTDADTLAWVDDLPDETYACLMRAKRIAEGDACMAGLAAAPAPEPASAPSPKCAAFAGSTDGMAHLRGVVRDAGGEVFAGATVVAEGPAGSLTAITDEDGAYLLENLAPGVYNVTVYAADLTAQRPCVEASGGTESAVDVTLP